MPFTKTGPNTYRSPSGRKFTKKQVKMYYATNGFKDTHEDVDRQMLSFGRFVQESSNELTDDEQAVMSAVENAVETQPRNETADQRYINGLYAAWDNRETYADMYGMRVKDWETIFKAIYKFDPSQR